MRMRLAPPGSPRTWLLTALWTATIVFAFLVGANDSSSSLLAKVTAGIVVLSGLATLLSLVQDLLRGGRGRGAATAGNAEPASTANDADRLAEAVRGAWSDEFEIRRVRLPLYSRMLLVQWGAADPDLASPLEVVITDPRAKADHGAVEHYELTIDIPTAHRVAAAFPELAQAI
jgi:hypothetical protein